MSIDEQYDRAIKTTITVATQPNDHIVSRGWQQNFADEERRVAVVDMVRVR